MIHEFTNSTDFKDFIKTFEGLLVLDFFATWCGPCQLMLPLFEKVSQTEALQNVYFAKINRDENRDLIDEYDFEIPTIPRFFVVKVSGGQLEILQDLGGTQSKTQLIEKITSFLQFAKPFKNEPQINSQTNLENQAENMAKSVIKSDNSTVLKEKSTTENQPHKPKIAVIGTGPAGLTAAIYASRASLDVVAFGGMMPGGQLTTTTEIENFPGAWDTDKQIGLYGTELIQRMQNQAEHFGAKIESGVVESLQFEMVGKKSKFTLKVDNMDKVFDGVIIASGATARYLGIDGEERFVGRGYHSCATCDGAFYRGKTVAIVGGGDSAMEEADFLTKFADKVYLLHRSQKFRASVVMLERAKKNPKIQIVTDVQITELIGEKNLEKVILNKTNNEPNLVINEEITKNNIWKILENGQIEMKLDGLFVAIGHDPNTGFVANLLDKNEAGYLIPQSRLPREERTSKYNMATKIPGVFLAGDVEDYEYRQAITAAAGGCRAAMELEKWLADLE
jgi:thioredoxin reductase (NADPH)